MIQICPIIVILYVNKTADVLLKKCILFFSYFLYAFKKNDSWLISTFHKTTYKYIYIYIYI